MTQKEKIKYIKEFKQTGDCLIDEVQVIKDWNHLFKIFQWKDTFRLVKFLRKDSPITTLKVGISNDQAYAIINKLTLTPEDGFFTSATTWIK